MTKIILEASSPNKLKLNTSTFFDTPRTENSRQVNVTDLSFIPLINNNELQVKAKTKTKLNSYITSILFEDVQYFDEDAPNTASFISGDETYYITPVNRTMGYVKVSCTCLDFYYMFSVWNHKDQSLQGDAPTPYVKKTDRAPRNPQKKPGLCKHLLRLSDEMIRLRILK